MNGLLRMRAMEWLWLIFAAYWLIGALTAAKVKSRESWSSSLPRTLILAAAAVLLFAHSLYLGVLDRRFVPSSPDLYIAGVLVTAAGLALAFWARYHLGRNWSSQITLKEGHTLVCSGPYRYLRHPIYSGILLAVVGTAFTAGRYRALLAIVLAGLGMWWKAAQEDAWLSRAFGEQFEEHRRRTGRLLPRFRKPAAL